MNEKTSKIDPNEKPRNEKIIKSRFEAEFHSRSRHGKSHLPDDEESKDVYELSYKPAANPKVNNRQSVHDRADPVKFMHPDSIGYQLLPNNTENVINKFKNNDADAVVLGIESSASHSPARPSRKAARSILETRLAQTLVKPAGKPS